MLKLQLILAARYLWGRKLRTFLTTLAIFFGTMVVFATNLMMPTMLKAFESNLLAASGQVDITITHETGEAFSTRILNQVKTIPGIRAISGSLSRSVNIPADFYGTSKITALTLTGIDPQDARTVRSYPLEVGRFLRSSEGNNALITTSLAKKLSLKLGDKLTLPTTDGMITLRIIGLQPERAMPGNEEVLVSLPEAQKLLDLPKRINTIEINLNTTDEAQRASIQGEIEALLGEDYSLGSLSSQSEIFASMKMGQAAFNLIGFLAMFMGAFIIFNTFRTIIAERRHDIGMLRTIGASRRTIVGIILTEGFIQGVVGTTLGIFAGYIIGAYVTELMGTMLTQFMNVQIGAPVIQPSLIVTTIFLGVGMTILAGLLPAVSASRVSPLEALRPTSPESAHKTARLGIYIGAGLLVLAILALFTGNIGLITLGGLCLLIGLVLVAPALVRPIAMVFNQLITSILARDGTGSLAQNNISRQPTRAAVTASATMIGLAIIVGLGGAISSITIGFMSVVERSLGSDYLIMPPSVAVWDSDVGAKQDLKKKLNSVPGVSVVSTLRFASSTLNGDAVNMLGIDPETYPQVASLTFQEGDPSTTYQELEESQTLIINGVTSAQTGLVTGDWVRISTPTGQKEYQIAAIAGDYLNAKVMTAYISQTNLEKDFHKEEDIFYQINVYDNADPVLVEQKLEKILEDYPQFNLVSGKDYLAETKTLFDAVFAGYGVLLAVLSVPSLIAMLNTLTIGVLERTREIGMLRAIGATRRQVRRIVVIESVLLAAIGTALGLLAGLYLGYIILQSLTTGGFPIEYSFPYTGLIAAVAAGLLFGALAAIIPARQASGMVIVRALRYE